MQMTGSAYGTRRTMTSSCLGNGAFKITHITGWRAYLGTAQHNYSHWTRVALPEGRPDMEQLEGTPGVLPFEVYSQAPLRLISWCSFELSRTARKLLRELAEMCELPETTTQALVTHIAAHNSEVKTEQEATQYLATLATVTISSRTKLLNYTTMVQHFLGTLQLPLAVYMLDYYLPMLSPNEGYNETGLTMQSAGPIRQPSQPIALEFLFKGSEVGHWKVKGGQDAFAFRHPSLGKTEVFSLLASDAHHHKVSPIGTGRLIAMVGTLSSALASVARSTAGGHWLELAIVLCCIAAALLALSVMRLTSSAISNNEVGTQSESMRAKFTVGNIKHSASRAAAPAQV